MANKKILLQVVTPERIFIDSEVERVEFTTSEGDVGVYYDHTPITTPLVSCKITIIYNSKEKKIAAIHSGFVEITPEKVTILTDAAEWPDEIDEKRANEAKTRALRRLETNEAEINEARVKAALSRAMARLEIIEKE